MSDDPETDPATSNLSLSKYRFVIAALLLAGHLSVGLNIFTVSPIFPLVIDEYQISRAAAGLLVALPLLVAAALGLPSGMLIARVGIRRSFIIGWASIALLSLSGLAPNFLTLVLLRSVIGLGFAFVLTASGPLLMQWFPTKEITVMNALTTAALSLGIALSVATAAPLSDFMDWQTALTVFALPGVAGLIAWMILGRESGGVPMSVQGLTLQEVGGVLRNRTVVLLLAADAGILVQYTAFTGWLPTFYNENRGISLSQAGFITGMLPLVGVFAVLVGGAVALRIRSPKVLFATSGVMAGLGGLGAFLFTEPQLIYPAVIVMGMGSWLYVPTLLTLPMQMNSMTPEKVAVVWGSFLTFSGFAMFVAPIFVGALRDVSGSFFPGLTIAALASWALLMAGLLMPRNVTESPARAAPGSGD
ncbi:MAG: MFS transporter [Dehalococcoidia bacterium]|nr:MFS transporter [Dehalococcoidia bacterium]